MWRMDWRENVEAGRQEPASLHEQLLLSLLRAAEEKADILGGSWMMCLWHLNNILQRFLGKFPPPGVPHPRERDLGRQPEALHSSQWMAEQF